MSVSASDHQELLSPKRRLCFPNADLRPVVASSSPSPPREHTSQMVQQQADYCGDFFLKYTYECRAAAQQHLRRNDWAEAGCRAAGPTPQLLTRLNGDEVSQPSPDSRTRFASRPWGRQRPHLRGQWLETGVMHRSAPWRATPPPHTFSEHQGQCS